MPTPTTKAYKTIFKNLEEVKDAVGKEIGLSEWYTMDQKRINEFADATGDHQWIHVDREKSRADSPYGDSIAHGFLVLSMGSRMAYDSIEIQGLAMSVNYGLNKVRFINATKADARIRGRFEILDFQESRGGARYIMKLTIEIEGEDKPACVAEWIGQAFTLPE